MVSTASPRDVAVVTPREYSGFWRYALPASLLSPLLLSLAYPKTNVAWFAFFALVPLFLLWARASWKQALLCGWLAGTIMFMLLFRWMTHSIGDFVGNWSWLALFLMSAIEGFSLAVVAVVTALVGRGRFRGAAVFAAAGAGVLGGCGRARGCVSGRAGGAYSLALAEDGVCRCLRFDRDRRIVQWSAGGNHRRHSRCARDRNHHGARALASYRRRRFRTLACGSRPTHGSCGGRTRQHIAARQVVAADLFANHFDLRRPHAPSGRAGSTRRRLARNCDHIVSAAESRTARGTAEPRS